MDPLIESDQAALARRGMVALELAILLAGGQGNLARLIGSTDQKVSHWKLRDFAVPMPWAPRIAAALRHPMVTVYTLRPDLADFWDMLRPQLVACAKGKARIDMLTEADFIAATHIYPIPRGFTRAADARADREQVSA
jgi:DNA-binding transcriptional regulator YdaS (Cro superfamily)